MNEIVPYQEKRQIVFAAGTTPLQAVTVEFSRYFKKMYPTVALSAENFAAKFAPLTSAALINDTELSWTIDRVVEPVLLLIETERFFAEQKIAFPKRRYLFLPKPYQKALKRTLISKTMLEKLTKAISSNKKATRTLRILHKRYGLFTQKKPKFM